MASERVGIYCRLSNEDRDKDDDNFSESIKTQQAMLTDYAIKQGWVIAKVYVDDNFSGGNQNRPAFKSMISDCENHNIDIVLCKSQSRFSREMRVIEDYLSDKFAEWQVRFVSVVDNIDTQRKGTVKARQINGLINEWYLMDVSDNVRSALKTKRERGEFVGAFAPYGYSKSPDDKHKLVVDPVASRVVKQIFEWYADGYGAITITKRLNQMKILSPSAYKKNNGSNYYQAVMNENSDKWIWVHSTISKMLCNEIYIGTLVQGKQMNVSYKNHKRVKSPESGISRIPNNHEPIISTELWETVQSIRKGKTRERKPAYSNYEPCPLIFVLRCKKCGGRMTRECKTFSYGKYIYATCARKRCSNEVCTNLYFYNMSDINQIVLDEINKLLDDYYDESLIKMKEDLTSQKSEHDVLSKRIETLEKSLKDKNNVKYSLYIDKSNGSLSEDDYIFFYNRLQEDTATINEEIESLRNRLKEIPTQTSSEKIREKILSKYRHINTLDGYIINEFIERVYLSKNSSKENVVEIHWKF